MRKREWKYLRHQYRERKGHFKIGFESFTIDNLNFGILGFDEKGTSNFAIMIPQQAFKPYVEVKKQRSRSEERYFLPIKY